MIMLADNNNVNPYEECKHQAHPESIIESSVHSLRVLSKAISGQSDSKKGLLRQQEGDIRHKSTVIPRGKIIPAAVTPSQGVQTPAIIRRSAKAPTLQITSYPVFSAACITPQDNGGPDERLKIRTLKIKTKASPNDVLQES
jgi:hypothetical protein